MWIFHERFALLVALSLVGTIGIASAETADTVLFNGKIYCTGTPEDYEQVHALQDKVTAVPLSSYGKAYTPAPGTIDPQAGATAPPRPSWTRST